MTTVNSIDVTDSARSLDPIAFPWRYHDVRRKRMVAFCLDFLIVCVLTVVASGIVLLLGLLTFGLAWMLFGGIFPTIAILYTALTISGPRRGTLGMRAAGLEMRMWYGEPVSFIVACMHIVFFYLSVTFLTPFILVVSLFDSKKRLLHDLVLGTVVCNDARSAAII
jgi:uncharacterized RDD family membrane protein YckC